jgi:glycine/D-amino acid oxidase-like deaminating enzyme
MKKFDAVIVGAGITGLAIAREFLKRGASIAIVDPNPPMTGTSAYSTECYRDVWHNVAMHGLVSKSIDLLEDLSKESDNAFGFETNQHGYLFVSNVPGSESTSNHHFNAFANGSTATSIRHHTNVASNTHNESMQSNQPKQGIDLLWGQDVVSKSFPHVRAHSALHARRAGWMDAQQLGAYLVQDIQHRGGVFIKDEVVAMQCDSLHQNSVSAVTLKRSNDNISTPVVVNAAGPFSGALSRLLVPSLPDPEFSNELHCKVIFKDQHQVVPSDSPMVILGDETTIPWDQDEQDWIDDLVSHPQDAEEAGLSKWLQPHLPSGCHVRPASNGWNVMLWEYAHHDKALATRSSPSCAMPDFYDTHVVPHVDPMYVEMTMRAMSTCVPGLHQYIGTLGGKDVTTDGGYYTYAPDRMPVIGQVDQVRGYCMANGVAGYGIMAAMGVAELICGQVEGVAGIDKEFNPNRLFVKELKEEMWKGIREEEDRKRLEQGSGGGVGGSL